MNAITESASKSPDVQLLALADKMLDLAKDARVTSPGVFRGCLNVAAIELRNIAAAIHNPKPRAESPSVCASVISAINTARIEADVNAAWLQCQSLIAEMTTAEQVRVLIAFVTASLRVGEDGR